MRDRTKKNPVEIFLMQTATRAALGRKRYDDIDYNLAKILFPANKMYFRISYHLYQSNKLHGR